MSPAHFARAFKQATGVAPHQYLISLRLDRTRAALLQGTAISEAALMFGFSDQAHFSRAFTKKFGVTPGSLVRASRPR
ncbi:MAG: helix-turn-helix transcriptional regulator [Sphingomonadales bacterium]|nr:helix-turn-helix transcriptional regulator [Sphingomonadales bacterium]